MYLFLRRLAYVLGNVEQCRCTEYVALSKMAVTVDFSGLILPEFVLITVNLNA